MKLVHADVLVLRGRARLLDKQPERAVDDTEEALHLARECGYPWAERDALFLQAEAWTAIGTERARQAARTARESAEAIAARLVLTEQDLADAEASAKAWMKERKALKKAR